MITKTLMVECLLWVHHEVHFFSFHGSNQDWGCSFSSSMVSHLLAFFLAHYGVASYVQIISVHPTNLHIPIFLKTLFQFPNMPTW